MVRQHKQQKKMDLNLDLENNILTHASDWIQCVHCQAPVLYNHLVPEPPITEFQFTYNIVFCPNCCICLCDNCNLNVANDELLVAINSDDTCARCYGGLYIAYYNNADEGFVYEPNENQIDDLMNIAFEYNSEWVTIIHHNVFDDDDNVEPHNVTDDDIDENENENENGNGNVTATDECQVD